jgi:hypothetical protein
MKPFCFIILLFIEIDTYSQGGLNNNVSKFQLGINLSPDISYRTYKDKSGANASLIQLLKDTENPKAGFTGGFNACYNINSRIGFEAGLQYSNKGYQTVKIPLTYISQKPTDPVTARFLYSLHYIDIPLKVNFTLGNSKLRFFGSTGLVTNVFIRERTTEWREYKEPPGTKEYKFSYRDSRKRVILSAMISAGICWQLNEKMNIRIEPTYRRSITPINNGISLCSAGLNLGLYYTL